MKKIVFRNSRAASVWIFVALGGILAFVAGGKDTIGFAGPAIAAYSSYAAFMHYLGVVVEGNAVWMPVPLLPRIPLVVIGRKRLNVNGIGFITSLGNRGGFETIAVDRVDFMQWVLFSTREQRLAFFNAIKAVRPDILIYRSR